MESQSTWLRSTARRAAVASISIAMVAMERGEKTKDTVGRWCLGFILYSGKITLWCCFEASLRLLISIGAVRLYCVCVYVCHIDKVKMDPIQTCLEILGSKYNFFNPNLK